MATSSRLSIMTPSSRKFAECVVLQCRSTRHLTGHVFPIKFIYHIQWKQSYESHSYIHTSMTSILSHVHTQTQYQFIHVCISRPEYCFNRVLSVRVLLIIVSSRKLQQMNVLHLPFILFQATSPKQWTAWVYLFIMFQVNSPKQRTAWVHLFYLVSSYQS